MKRFFTILAICFAAKSANAQMIIPAILNSSTTRGNVGNISFELSLGETFTTTISNGTVVTQGFLQPMAQSSNSPLPVFGLAFFTKRINGQQVQLEWKTLQEINNKGFSIERKKEGENNFVPVRFVPSQANGGNSNFPLAYTQTDSNSYNGKTYYRLKQEDLNGQATYSAIRVVDGNVAKTIVLKAWPIPAKEFYVNAEGIQKETLQIIDASGKIIRQLLLLNNQPVLITGLPAGTYFLRLQSETNLMQKVIVN